MGNRRLIMGVVILVGLAMLATFLWNSELVPSGRSVQQSDQPLSSDRELPLGLSIADYQQAEKWYRQRYPSTEPTREDVFMIAGEIASADQQYDTALACYRAIPTTAPTQGLKARLEEGLTLVKLNRAAAAEASLRAFLDAARIANEVSAADVVTAFKWLNFILSVQIRLEDRRPLLAEMHQIALADPLDSKQLFFPNLLLLNSPTGRTRLDQFIAADPTNTDLRIAQARYKTMDGQFDAALALLEPLMAQQPGNTRIGAALAEALFESSDMQKLANLVSTLPAYSTSEPWSLTRMRGELAMEENDFQAAINHFLAVLHQDPANAPCQMGLATCYGQLGKTNEQQEALRKSSILAEIRVNLSSVQTDAPAAASELAAKCEAIGFETAAQAFRLHAQSMPTAQPPRE
jgi:tetratricopeptide (TPR) repeat protein